MIILKQNIWPKFFIFLFWIFLIFIFLYFPIFRNIFFEKNTINILVWADMIDLDTISRFQNETGIKVNVNYYENNEELFAKLQVTQGQEYDLITITDIGVDYLKNKNLIKKIDKSRLNFWDKIEPNLLNNYFDPNNEFSIPYNWDIYGIGINLEYLDKALQSNSWHLIFNEKILPSKISMTDDANDAILISAKYLFGSIENINAEKLKKIKELLIKQKKWVEVYTDLRTDYFLRLGICPIVVSQSSYFYRAMKENGILKFVIPKEGSFVVIDSLVIPKQSKKDDLIYQFVNFLYKEDEIRGFYNKFGYLPVLKDILYSLNLEYIGNINDILLNFKKFSFFKKTIPLDVVSKLWIDVKAA